MEAGESFAAAAGGNQSPPDAPPPAPPPDATPPPPPSEPPPNLRAEFTQAAFPDEMAMSLEDHIRELEDSRPALEPHLRYEMGGSIEQELSAQSFKDVNAERDMEIQELREMLERREQALGNQR